MDKPPLVTSVGRDEVRSSRPFCFAHGSPMARAKDAALRIRRAWRIGHKTSGTNRLAGTNEVRKNIYGLYGFSDARRFRRDAR
jgi:hypothetical protein